MRQTDCNQLAYESRTQVKRDLLYSLAACPPEQVTDSRLQYRQGNESIPNGSLRLCACILSHFCKAGLLEIIDVVLCRLSQVHFLALCAVNEFRQQWCQIRL